MVVVSHLFPFYGKILPNYSHFNPRLREGGDSFSFDTSLQIYNFNPRLREGGDVRFCEPYLTSSIFQSTPPRRRRPRPVAGGELRCQFQSTPPRRRRPPCPASESLGLQYFNPRLREGGDGKLINAGLTLIQFQSTPPRRRRPYYHSFTVVRFEFQSTPPRRRRRKNPNS